MAIMFCAVVDPKNLHCIALLTTYPLDDECISSQYVVGGFFETSQQGRLHRTQLCVSFPAFELFIVCEYIYEGC